jgi:glucosamine--fructose-6-phosphate aminotransferase (isomerizing)
MTVSALSRTIESQADLLEPVLDLDLTQAVERLREAQQIWLVGTGTSQHAAELGARMFEAARRNARWSSAAGFARFGANLAQTDAVIVISHTAETAFARSARDRAGAAGASLVSITGFDSGWREAIETVPRESSETYTVSYTATLLVLARLSAALGAEAITADGLKAIPRRVRDAVRSSETEEIDIPDRLLVFAGVGPYAVTAREGALKVREATAIVSEGFEAEYLLHGSAVPLGRGDSLVLVQPDADPDGLSSAIGDAARSEGVAVTSIAEPGGLGPLLAQIPLTVRLQVLASRFAQERGTNPDEVIVGAWGADELWKRGGPAV